MTNIIESGNLGKTNKRLNQKTKTLEGVYHGIHGKIHGITLEKREWDGGRWPLRVGQSPRISKGS